MAIAVQTSPLSQFSEISLGLSRAFPTREVIVLGAILAILQVLDGLLTGIGMHQFGIQAEGNILLRWLMEHLGYVNALVMVKSFALGVIACLVFLSTEIRWIGLAFKGIIGIYLCAAVIPWTSILIRHLV